MTKNDALVSVSDCSHILRISAGAVRVAADRGDLPCVRASNGSRLFKASDIETFRVARLLRRSKAVA